MSNNYTQKNQVWVEESAPSPPTLARVTLRWGETAAASQAASMKVKQPSLAGARRRRRRLLCGGGGTHRARGRRFTQTHTQKTEGGFTGTEPDRHREDGTWQRLPFFFFFLQEQADDLFTTTNAFA